MDAQDAPRTAPFPQPAVPDGLMPASSLAGWLADEVGGSGRAAHVHVAGDAESQADFALLELEASRVEDCRYAACDFSRAVFEDVAFCACDFSNCDFSEASFTRCTFSSCKLTGADFCGAVLRLTGMRDCSCSYATFAKAKLEDFAANASDFSYADIVEARLVRVAFDDVRFASTSFFRTSLAGVDLTACRLSAIVLSDTMAELRGCTMDLCQAAGIAQRLGVIVEG